MKCNKRRDIQDYYRLPEYPTPSASLMFADVRGCPRTD
jgi:hypothetical protein